LKGALILVLTRSCKAVLQIFIAIDLYAEVGFLESESCFREDFFTEIVSDFEGQVVRTRGLSAESILDDLAIERIVNVTDLWGSSTVHVNTDR